MWGNRMPEAVAGTTWIEMETVAPVSKSVTTFEVLVRLSGGGLFARPLNTAPFKALHGLLFAVTGYVSGTADNNTAAPWEIEARILDDGTPLSGFVLNVKHMAVWWPDAPLRAERIWYEGQRVADTIEQARPATPDDHRRAADALTALERFTERIAVRGKHRGDGATWAGGDPDFLDDLWTTLEMRTAATGTSFGHDPASRLFRTNMREHPGERVLRTWLTRNKLRVTDIKAGKVTRANYVQFVAK
jgi:hypothetical protein